MCKAKKRTTNVQKNDAIVNPAKPKNAPDLGPVAVMAATRTDLFSLCEVFNFDKNDFYRLMTSRLYVDRLQPPGFSVTGPFVVAFTGVTTSVFDVYASGIGIALIVVWV